MSIFRTLFFSRFSGFPGGPGPKKTSKTTALSFKIDGATVYRKTNTFPKKTLKSLPKRPQKPQTNKTNPIRDPTKIEFDKNTYKQ